MSFNRQRFSFSYDTLRRPVDRTVSVSGGSEKLLGRIVYGDLLATPEDTNHVGRVYRVYDGAGVATTVAFDFKGHATSEQRQLVNDKTTQPDWSDLLSESTIAAMATAAASLLDSETFEASSERDALGRVLVAISPDDSEVLYSYDEGGGLQKVELKHRGSSTAQTVIGDITYNARGQREQVIYGSTSSPTMTTSYGYDPQTYRLAHMSTIRESDDASLQGLHYHYDPVGNITDIRDTAQQTVYFQNSVVEAANSYEYDAVYRLIEATGREHASQGTTQRTHEQLPVGPQPMTSDPSAMRRYTQKYTYDSVGNILTMQHIPASGSGWTRYYQYDEAGNRLEATSAPGDDPEGPYTHTYSYDNHGSMTAMPHLSSMIWNHQDELQEVTVGTETVYFQYAGGMRSRKYTEKAGAVTEERIYLGAFEIYRKRLSGTLDLERESLHISDGTGRICIVETKTVGSGSPLAVWRYQLGNHLGSAATEVDENGDVISYEEYHPYGTSAYRAVDSSVDVSAKRYRYTGMERDEETGLAYHSVRYLVPWLGRWTAADPIAIGDGTNRFAYVSARPVVLLDPMGTFGAPPDPVDQRRQNPEDWDSSLRVDAKPHPDSQKKEKKSNGSSPDGDPKEGGPKEDPGKANGVPGGTGPGNGSKIGPAGTGGGTSGGTSPLDGTPATGAVVHQDKVGDADEARAGTGGNGTGNGEGEKNGNLLDKVAQIVGIFLTGETGSDAGVSGGAPGGQGDPQNASMAGQIVFLILLAAQEGLGSAIAAGRSLKHAVKMARLNRQARAATRQLSRAAGDCTTTAEKLLDIWKHRDPKLVANSQKTQTGHYAVQIDDGTIIDPTLRNNMKDDGVEYLDIPEDKIYFTPDEWSTLNSRFQPPDYIGDTPVDSLEDLAKHDPFINPPPEWQPNKKK